MKNFLLTWIISLIALLYSGYKFKFYYNFSDYYESVGIIGVFGFFVLSLIITFISFLASAVIFELNWSAQKEEKTPFRFDALIFSGIVSVFLSLAITYGISMLLLWA